jgi:hypothetical protein
MLDRKHVTVHGGCIPDLNQATPLERKIDELRTHLKYSFNLQVNL